MPLMNVTLDLDHETYAGVKAGIYTLSGMAKHAKNNRVHRHIPTVPGETKNLVKSASRFMLAHKSLFLVGIAALVIFIILPFLPLL